MVNVRMKVMVFEISLPDPALWIMALLFSATQLFIMLPMNNFAVFYMIVCRHFQLVITNFTKYLRTVHNSEYEKVLNDYISIRKFVSEMDNKISFLVLTSSLYNACTMYFGISVILHPEEYFNVFQCLAVSCLVIGSSMAYFGLTMAGSLIYESGNDLWLQAHKVLCAKPEITIFQHRFLSMVEKNLFVTVWKILPITRNFVFTVTGTVLTYCVALDSIQSLKNISAMWNCMA
ncbi:hypothetical protein AVEN_213997-1 [Araneus ventricosus]|uniref:Odorant receptor n=1 Tax=Araneus ventricosus TaxID=182803 RepID=A0A4Y2QJU3_ARAVE|nr:hypothetical protein AVEN_205092-1 [Araneus ventricosus]GBN63402.1 hypothetical protein AVEN_228189-1 [Araneus ventricosus]GBN63511.1 hypothetical protein AVEN_49613-1 [Araneus ventricosus]GBN63560.1 hypothetical protein AVEN_213997-1 [Araneus ventricosus]